MNIEHIRTFLSVVQAGGFTKAARQLKTTQPVISNRVSALEDQLKCKLLIRTRASGPVKLTTKGEEFHNYATQIVNLFDDARQSLANPTSKRVFRLGVTDTVVNAWLPVFLAELNSTYEDVQVDLTVGSSRKLHDQLQAGTLDLAVSSNPTVNSGFAQVALPDVTLRWYGRRDNSTTQVQCIDNLVGRLPVASFDTQSESHQQIQNFLEKRFGTTRNVIPTSSVTVKLQMIKNGAAIGVLPDIVASQEAHREQLVELDADWKPNRLKFCAVYRATNDCELAESVAKLARNVACRFKRSKHQPQTTQQPAFQANS